MKNFSPVEIVKRYAALKNHRIYSMPIVILMPHSRCNCRCVMCDIWKGNNNLQQLNESDIQKFLNSLKKIEYRGNSNIRLGSANASGFFQIM